MLNSEPGTPENEPPAKSTGSTTGCSSLLYSSSFLAHSFLALFLTGCAGSSDDSAALKRQSGQQPINPAPPRAAGPGDWFEDVSERSGVRFTYRTGSDAGQLTVLESIGGGVALLDYDRDGDLDLFLVGGGTITPSLEKATGQVVVQGLPSALFRNEGDWLFSDVTAAVGLAEAWNYTHGCAVADYNRDGFVDLLVSGYGAIKLYQNIMGERFSDVTESVGLSAPGWNTSAAWADYDRDGWVDLFVTNYLKWTPHNHKVCGLDQPKVCPPGAFEAAEDLLFKNVQGERFENVTQQVKLSSSGKGLGVVAADFDLNGWIDFYVANDETENHLYWNDGGELTEGGLLAGVAYGKEGRPEGGMGVVTGDLNADGLPDLWVTNFETEDNALYLNDGNRMFRHTSAESGLAGVSKPLVGFGTVFSDFDSDGWLDIFVANGHVDETPRHGQAAQPAQLFRSLAGTRYREISEKAAPYFTIPHTGRGAAVGDLDNDGGPDLVIVHQNETVTLLRNRNPPKHWIGVSLQGTRQSPPSGIGALVSLDRSAQTITRLVAGGGGYLSHSDSRVVFALENAEPVTLRIRWPSGKRERFIGLGEGRNHLLIEGEGEPNGAG